MKHPKQTRYLFVRSLVIVGGVLGLGALLSSTAPAAAASSDDATTTWTANFQAVNSTPVPDKGWIITLTVGCHGATIKTKLDRGDTLDVSCTVSTTFAHLAYTIEWEAVSVKETHVETYEGTAWHSCDEQDETAKVTITSVGRSPLESPIVYSTQCFTPSTSSSSDDDPT